MSNIVLALGSNLGNKLEHIHNAKKEISKLLSIIEESAIYSSAAVDYLEQPPFLNQVITCQLSKETTPNELMKSLLAIEQLLGRKRVIDKGPRVIDIDIIFWGNESIKTDLVIIPHPRWFNRSFVVHPLRELPYSKTLEKFFTFPKTTANNALPIL